MSATQYGSRPIVPNPADQSHVTGLSVSSRLIRLDPGMFALSLMPPGHPGATDPGPGLPAVRVSVPPGPPGRREVVNISTFRGDGWMTANDEPTLFRVLPGGAEVLVTLYWSGTDAETSAPPLKLVRVNPEPSVGGPFDTSRGAIAGVTGPDPGAALAGRALSGIPVRSAEVVAHIEGVGDVEGKFGDWVGMRGSGRAIEGFSMAPRQSITTEDFEIRAVLGRDWLSPWLPGGSFCGSRGLALPLRGFCVRLHPGVAARYDLNCYARFVDGSEVGPVGPDRLCASTNLAALEAFQVLVRPRVA